MQREREQEREQKREGEGEIKDAFRIKQRKQKQPNQTIERLSQNSMRNCMTKHVTLTAR